MDLRHGGRAREVDTELHPSQGSVPEGLAGTLYRNGAGNHLSDYVIDGDGLVSAVTFAPGRPVRVRSRYVRTPSYQASLDARDGEAPPLRLGGANAPGGRLRNMLRLPAAQANTSVTMIDDRLMSLWEADMPWELDPATLETLGRCDLNGGLKPSGRFEAPYTPYSAHPCWDPATAELWNFGCVYAPRSRLEIYRSRRGGSTDHVRSIRIPRRFMVHDFAMTATHLVFCLGPVILDVAAMMSGRLPAFQSMRWHGDEPTRILLVPRAGGPFRVVETDPWFQWHFAGAYDDGPDIVFDLVRFRSWTVMHEAISSIGHLTDPSSLPIGRLVGEPLFVPRDRDETNDEGWLIVYANDIAAGTTDIVVFNARAVADGPVCTLPVPESLGYSFHGQWTQARP